MAEIQLFSNESDSKEGTGYWIFSCKYSERNCVDEA
jgi:hypothetical protein